MDELRDALTSDDVDVGQAELLYRNGVYYLHVTVTREFDVPEPNTADTLVGVDINERNVALTALDRETLRTNGTLVLDYGRVKQERQRYHTITKRCQEHGKTSIHHRLGDTEERFSEWVLQSLSCAVVEFAEQFSNSVIMFEDMSSIYDEIEYGKYMNHRLHSFYFHNFENFFSWREIPIDTVDAYYNSQTCSCCGERGSRQGRRFQSPNDKCDVGQDHADRNASMNIAWREKAKIDGNTTNYRTHRTLPQVRVVRLSGPGRVSRPTSSRSLAEQGVLAQGRTNYKSLGPPRPRLFIEYEFYS
jgi:putative transposase